MAGGTSPQLRPRRGGAEVPGRQDIGVPASGKLADIIGCGLIRYGLPEGRCTSQWRRFLQPPKVGFSMVNGMGRVKDGQLEGPELEALVR